MAKKKVEHEMVMCPVGKFFSDLEKASGRRSKRFVHLDRSRVEQKSPRCAGLVDERGRLVPGELESGRYPRRAGADDRDVVFLRHPVSSMAPSRREHVVIVAAQ